MGLFKKKHKLHQDRIDEVRQFAQDHIYFDEGELISTLHITDFNELNAIKELSFLEIDDCDCNYIEIQYIGD